MASVGTSIRNFVLRVLRRIRSEALELGITLRWILAAIVLGLLITQATSFASRLGLASSHQAIIEAIDNDSGEGIRVGQRSYWFWDNHFRYYGPLYYRVANTLSFGAVSPGPPTPGPVELGAERQMHFALILLSLISLYALAWVLCAQLTNDVILRGIGVFLLLPSFMAAEFWSFYLYTVHPDLFLAFLCAAGMIASIKMGQDPDHPVRWKWAALWWGLALATKLSALFLMPMQLFFVWKNGWKATWPRIRRFALFALSVYVLVGFPQNLDFAQNLRVLFSFSKYSGPFSVESFVDWWTLWGTQILWPVVSLFGFWLITRAFSSSAGSSGNGDVVEGEAEIVRGQVWWIPLAVSGLAIFSVRSLELAHDYYVFPFVAAALGAIVMLAKPWRFGFLQRSSFGRILLVVAGVALTIPGGQKGNAQNLHALSQQRTCQESFQRAFDVGRTVVDQGRKVFATPYTPVSRHQNVDIDWEMNLARMNEAKPELMMFNPSYYARYTDQDEVAPYVQKNNDHWKSTQEFFRTFRGQTEVTLAGGQIWRKIQNPEFQRCQIEIWEKSAPPSL